MISIWDTQISIYPESLVGESSVGNPLKASSHLIPLKWMLKWSGSHPVSCRESWVTNSSRKHAHQQVLDEAHAVAHIQQPCLQHAEWRHVSAEIKPQDLSKTAQELHDHKTVWETSSGQQQTRYPWQRWQRLHTERNTLTLNSFKNSSLLSDAYVAITCMR